IQNLMEQHDKTEVLIGFEATGHYWMNLAFYLKISDLPFVLVNPLHVKQSKEMDDNIQTKNDTKDARVIAKLLPNGYFSVPRDMTTVDHNLRQGSSIRERIRKDIGAVKNRIQRWIDLYFPEFRQVFKHYGQQELAVLKLTPLPEDIKNASVEDLVRRQKEAGAKYAGRPKMIKLIELAQHSIGIKDGEYMAKIEIRALVQQLELLQFQLEEITAEMVQQAKKLPEFEYLVSIKGNSENTVSELLAATRSPEYYNPPRQITKPAPVTERENSSGKHRGTKKSSKRGSRRLPGRVCKATRPLIRPNPAVHTVYT